MSIFDQFSHAHIFFTENSVSSVLFFPSIASLFFYFYFIYFLARAFPCLSHASFCRCTPNQNMSTACEIATLRIRQTTDMCLGHFGSNSERYKRPRVSFVCVCLQHRSFAAPQTPTTPLSVDSEKPPENAHYKISASAKRVSKNCKISGLGKTSKKYSRPRN